MTGFHMGQRVLVSRVGLDGTRIDPTAGTVTRLLMRDDGAWIELDRRQGDAAHPFPPDDRRGKHVLSYPEWCEPLAATAPK